MTRRSTWHWWLHEECADRWKQRRGEVLKWVDWNYDNNTRKTDSTWFIQEREMKSRWDGIREKPGRFIYLANKYMEKAAKSTMSRVTSLTVNSMS